MANKINYQKLMEDLIKENCMDNNCTPRLLLHSCCGPCSTYCIQTLSEYFDVTVFYYNPNIYPPEEYHMRAQEQKRFIDEFPVKNPVHFVEGVYDTRRFYDMARGMEAVPEGGERCFKCYRLRLEESAQYAREHGFDFFTTTLSISPLKNAEKLIFVLKINTHIYLHIVILILKFFYERDVQVRAFAFAQVTSVNKL